MKKIIAVDFDGTLCVDKYPLIGEPRTDVIERLKREQQAGARTILWTCRRGEPLLAAIYWCLDHGLTFEAVNENLPEIVEKFGGDTRKIYADEYWDDRAVLPFEREEKAERDGGAAIADLILNVIEARVSLNKKTAEKLGDFNIDGVIACIKAEEAETLRGFISIITASIRDKK